MKLVERKPYKEDKFDKLDYVDRGRQMGLIDQMKKERENAVNKVGILDHEIAQAQNDLRLMWEDLRGKENNN